MRGLGDSANDWKGSVSGGNSDSGINSGADGLILRRGDGEGDTDKDTLTSVFWASSRENRIASRRRVRLLRDEDEEDDRDLLCGGCCVDGGVGLECISTMATEAAAAAKSDKSDRVGSVIAEDDGEDDTGGGGGERLFDTEIRGSCAGGISRGHAAAGDASRDIPELLVVLLTLPLRCFFGCAILITIGWELVGEVIVVVVTVVFVSDVTTATLLHFDGFWNGIFVENVEECDDTTVESVLLGTMSDFTISAAVCCNSSEC